MPVAGQVGVLGLRALGGCCGTNDRHIECLTQSSFCARLSRNVGMSDPGRYEFAICGLQALSLACKLYPQPLFRGGNTMLGKRRLG